MMQAFDWLMTSSHLLINVIAKGVMTLQDAGILSVDNATVCRQCNWLIGFTYCYCVLININFSLGIKMVNKIRCDI